MVTTVLFHFAMKKINMIIIIARGFYRRQKHEEARRINYQFKVDEDQVYAGEGIGPAATELSPPTHYYMDKENERPKYTPADHKNADRKMFENIEDASSFWIQLWKSQGTGNRNAQWLEDIRSAIYSRVPSPSEKAWKLDTMEATKVPERKKGMLQAQTG